MGTHFSNKIHNIIMYKIHGSRLISKHKKTFQVRLDNLFVMCVCFVASKKSCSKYIDFITKTRGWLHAGWMPLSLQICPAILVGVPASLMEYRLLKYEPVLLSIHLQAFGFLLTPPAEHEDEIKFLLYLFTLRCIRGSLNEIHWCYFTVLYFLLRDG